MANIGSPIGVLEMSDVKAAARTLGIEVAPLEIRRAEDIAPAFAALKAQADGLYVVGDALIVANLTRIITFSHTARHWLGGSAAHASCGKNCNSQAGRCN